MKRAFKWISVLAMLVPVGCGSDGDGAEPAGNACEQACQKLESCGNTTCTINGNDCSGQARDIADCINESPCDQTNQCLFGGVGGSGGGTGGTGATGGSGGGSGSCADIAGTWQVSGTCGVDACVITQSGCSVNFVCDDGAASYTGSVTASSVSFTGVTGSCQGAVSANQIAGTCSGPLGACTFNATR